MAVLLKTVPRLPIVLRTFLNPCNHLVMGAVLESRGDIFNSINSLHDGFAPGVDGIPPVFLTSCNLVMSRMFWLIFEKSLSCGIFPSLWKLSIVTPVFKDGDRSLVSNYRSISKQNPMPKIFENIVAGKLSALSKNALIDEQHGFVADRSTVTNLLIYHDFIISAVEESSQIDAVYTNFRKAFDNVDHAVLLRKLQAFGIGGLWLKWLSDFVTDRLQTT
ncbi:uncharacterized protein LOC112638705 [Camponotus floridanus]|uniref:uncharacterized protein LOC112638705 n=1 Tax=Camponotus floridanus TaxID=104421 RepID=UPI000DC6B199|nr:uncharacterized protein LOC112638705 [Camponotus floridanus]